MEDDVERDGGGLSLECGDPPAAISLAETLDLKAASLLARDLLSRRGSPLDIDAGEVRRLGGLCLQVLLSAQKTWDADGASFCIRNPSPAFAEGWANFGASPRLDAPLEIGL